MNIITYCAPRIFKRYVGFPTEQQMIATLWCGPDLYVATLSQVFTWIKAGRKPALKNHSK